MPKLVSATHWLAAVSLLATFYAHTFLGVERDVATPAFAVAVLLALVTGALFSVPLRNFVAPTSPMRLGAGALGVVSLVFFASVAVYHFLEGQPEPKDVGDFALVCGLPILVWLQADRQGLFEKISVVCVALALADAAWNVATLVGLVAPIQAAGRLTEYGNIVRYPGLTGNTLAGGLVSFVAVCPLAFAFAQRRGLLIRMIIGATLMVILLDMVLIDARRFTGMAFVACVVLITPWLHRRAPLHIIAVLVAALFAYLTFSSSDPENIMRWNLTAAGWEDAMMVFWTGAGVHHLGFAPATYQRLWEIGITESGFVDLAKTYGTPATLAFVFSGLLALAASRRMVSATSMEFAMLLAALENDTLLGSFLGATLYYLTFMIVVLEELPIQSGGRVWLWRPREVAR